MFKFNKMTTKNDQKAKIRNCVKTWLKLLAKKLAKNS